MVFSSVLFLFYFFPIFFLLYYLTPPRFRNGVILIGSIFFYAWGAPKFIFVLLFTTGLDFLLVNRMWTTESTKLRKLYLLLSLGVNLGLLFYFKYSNFFIDNLNALLTSAGMHPVAWAELLLPIGISFYTFETITYVVDVYRKVHAPLKKFWDYQTYIILFPKLIAGPIIRYQELADQITDRRAADTLNNRLQGFYRFMIGLGKKVLLANPMGAYSDTIFTGNFSTLSTASAWLGLLSYTFQIYFDFSGYSDMAIGLGKMMGFRFPENFQNPYTATSVTDFWRRWHITLGTWMRNYLYIPLGGNRVFSKGRLYFNLWLVFLASGLWHGAAWGFIFWGAFHGFFLIVERSFLGRWLQKLGRWAVIYTFGTVMIGWSAFRIENLSGTFSFWKRLFIFHTGPLISPPAEYVFTLLLCCFFSFFVLFPKGQLVQDKLFVYGSSARKHLWLSVASLLLLVICCARIVATDFNPFIYFRF